MGRTGYPPAEEARAARLDHIQSPTQRAPGITAGHSPAQARAAAHSPAHARAAAIIAGSSGRAAGDSPEAIANSPEQTGSAGQGSPGAAGNSPGADANSPGPVAEGLEGPNVELSRFSYAASIESCDVYGAPAPVLISRYERNPPPETVEGKPGQSNIT